MINNFGSFKFNPRFFTIIILFIFKSYSWHIISEEFRQTDTVSFQLTGWTINGNPLTTSNIINECQTTFVKIENGQTLEKAFSIQYFEFSQIRVELNAYFYDLVDSSVTINFSGITEVRNVYAANSITTTTLCSNSAPSAQYLLNYIGSSSSSEFILSITFSFPSAGNLASFLGIRDIIIFTDSAVAMNGCPLELPILNVTGTCAAKCEDYGQQLSGHYLNKCLAPDDINGVILESVQPIDQANSNNIDGNYLNAQVSYFRSTDYTSSTTDYIYSNFVTSQLQTIQIQGSIYLIDWEAASSVTINVNDESDMFTISQIGSEFITNPPSSIQPCTITLTDNSKVQTQTSEINSQILLDISSQFMILLIQSLSSATYAFSNFYTYNAQPTKYCNNFAYNTFCMSCDSPYWAYRGQCDDSCPPYTKSDFENRRCIDLSEYETKENIPDIATNAKGYYLAKITEDDLEIQNSDIESLFSSVPSPTDNYQNGQKYSLLPDKKMIGGYNSWRYGFYHLSYTQLPTHYQIRIFADLYLLDGWTATDQFIITIDSTTETTTIAGLQSQGLYGLPEVDYFTSIFYRVPHTSGALDVIFQCRGITVDSTQASCGMTNLFIMYDVDVTTLCTSTTPYQFWSFVTNKCEDCDASCQTGCQLESTQCNGCHYSCQSCNTGTTASDCQSCSSAFHRSLVGTECQCDSGYVDSGYGMCSTVTGCHYSCASCYKSNDANSCASCPDSSTSFRLAGTNQDCVCQSGYEDTGNQICSEQSNCHFSCATCSDDSSTGCLTCPDNSTSHRTIDSGAHTCSCDAGYQESTPDSPTCIKIDPCDISCSLCSVASSPTSCVACPDNSTSHRTYNSGSHTCPCDSNYIETNPLSTNCAMQCHKSCALCSIPNSSTNCSTCGDNSTTHRTYDGSNGCPCDDGYEEQNPINANCIVISPCHYSCELCSSISDSNTCVSCPDNSVSHRTLVGSVCQCDSGYQDTTSQQNCVIQCHYSCETCSSPNSSTNCDSCIPAATSHRNYDNSAHTCNCENGYIEDGTNPNCKMDCHYSCITCSSPQDQNACSSCDNSMNRISGTNSDCPCKPGYEDISNAALCTAINPCHETCDLCSVISSSNSCISCVPSQFRELNGSNECVCINGYQEQIGNPICSIQCHFTCLTCSIPNDANGCTTCPSSAETYRIEGKNQNCICQFGFVEIQNQLKCELQCHYSCATCSASNESNACITCTDQSISNRVLNQNQCLCQDGYTDFGSEKNCSLDCHYSCETCTVSYLENACLTCLPLAVSHRTLTNDHKCICEEQYKAGNGQALCIPICHETCLTCRAPSSSDCYSCKEEQNRELQGSICQCKQGYYEIVGQSICQQKCHQTCQTCSSPNNEYACLSCQIPSKRQLVKSQCKCIEGYFENDQQECQMKCHHSCDTCTEPLNEEKCSNCGSQSVTNRRLKNNKCECIESYVDVGNQNCQSCPNKCLACKFVNNQIQCIKCEADRTFINNQCQCDSNHYEYAGVCQPCSSDLVDEQCSSIDSILQTKDFCDDSNKILRDGCSYNKVDKGWACVNDNNMKSKCIKCPNNCEACKMLNHELICLSCQSGYYQHNHDCLKCDQRCSECTQKYECTKCTIQTELQNGKCIDCDATKGLYLEGSSCVAKCGDGIIAGNEECDDGNLIDFDGCSHLCILEKGYSCKQDACQQFPSINASIDYQNITTKNSLILELINVRANCSNITIDIENKSKDLYSFNVNKLNSSSSLKCGIDITYYDSIEGYEFIRVFLWVERVLSNNRLLNQAEPLEIEIKSRRHIEYSESQNEASQSALETQEKFGQALIAIGPTTIFLGGFDLFMNILDILTWLDNFYFINVNYPLNVQLIFKYALWGQIELIQFPFEIDYQSTLPEKFVDRNIDSLFIQNVWSCLIIWGITLFSGLSCKLLLKLINWAYQSNKKQKEIKQSFIFNVGIQKQKESIKPQVIVEQHKLPKIIKLIKDLLIQYSGNLSQLIIKCIYLTYIDLTMACIIQFKYNEYSQKPIFLLNSILALLFIIPTIGILVFAVQISKKSNYLLNHKSFKQFYGQFYEDLKLSQSSSKTFIVISYLKKILFTFSIVILYEYPILQSTICSMISFFGIYLCLLDNPFTSKTKYIQIAIPDITIFLILSSTIVIAFNDQIKIIDNNSLFNLGWFIISLIVLSLLIQVYFILREFVNTIIKRIKQIKELCQ